MPEIGESRKKGGLIRTGQITQYGGYQDDGLLQKGLSKRYVILTTGPRAGTTDITVNAKTDAHSNNCVYDRRTKLTWSRYFSDSLGPASDGKLPWTTNGNGEGIFTYVAAANAAKLAGYSDWRIPNAHELNSLFQIEAPAALPDTTAFPTFTSSIVLWSATTRTDDTTNAMSPEFLRGRHALNLKTSTQYLLLVRGG